jgi:hypothetical protein
MDAIYFLCMLLGVAWLAVWSILAPEQQAKGWWPFDFLEEEPRHAGSDPSKASRAGKPNDAAGGRTPAKVRRNPGAPGRSPDPAADVQHAVPEHGAIKPWRLRRKPPSASGR